MKKPTTKPITTSGRQLYALLPELYRTKDTDDQLAAYLDAFGIQLDQLRNTLDQRLADCFPDNAPYDGERSCQSWLIPYFAKLIDARLYAPDAEGQREEVSKGVGWRKSKGTIACIEEIAEAVWRMDIEVQEGWKRVAVTPRINMPQMALSSMDNALMLDLSNHSQAAKHPGLPAATTDVRFASQAVAAKTDNPAARQTDIGGDVFTWRQNNRHGAPMHVGGYDDVSRRTPDMRQSDWRQGHADVRKVLLFAPPPAGFFSSESVSIAWPNVDDEANHLLLEHVSENDVEMYRNISGKQLLITGSIKLDAGKTYSFEDLQLNTTVQVSVDSRISVRRCVLSNIVVLNKDMSESVLDARDSIFAQIDGVAKDDAGKDIPDIAGVAGNCLLEYCTVLGVTNVGRLLASDCIFAGDTSVHEASSSCVRYSRINHLPDMQIESCVDLVPIFFSTTSDNPVIERSCGVLHPSCPEEIRFGAEDGGEMGVFHYRHYCLREQAVVDKLMEFLPLGIEPVLIPDSRMAGEQVP